MPPILPFFPLIPVDQLCLEFDVAVGLGFVGFFVLEEVQQHLDGLPADFGGRHQGDAHPRGNHLHHWDFVDTAHMIAGVEVDAVVIEIGDGLDCKDVGDEEEAVHVRHPFQYAFDRGGGIGAVGSEFDIGYQVVIDAYSAFNQGFPVAFDTLLRDLEVFVDVDGGDFAAALLYQVPGQHVAGVFVVRDDVVGDNLREIAVEKDERELLLLEL